MNEPVTIIGGGRWGTALSVLAAGAGRDVTLFVRDAALAGTINDTRRNARYWPDYELPQTVRATSDLRHAAQSARLVIMTVPSGAFRAAARALGPHLRGDHVVVHTARGIEQGTHLRMSQVLRRETPVKRMGALSGPAAPEEVMDAQPAGCVVASRYPEVVDRAQAALAGDNFRVYGSRDLTGVEIAGAMNNVVAVCAGVLQGVGLGAGTRAMLVTRGAAEIRRLGLAAGAMAETFAGLGGIGDLMAACTGQHSTDFAVGRRLAAGEPLDKILESVTGAAEGAHTAAVAHALASRLGIDMPITWGVHSMLNRGADPAQVRNLLMARSAKYE
jgi:glycerol-3-phosphate dehydrogenase (NAD(P)+)